MIDGEKLKKANKQNKEKTQTQQNTNPHTQQKNLEPSPQFDMNWSRWTGGKKWQNSSCLEELWTSSHTEQSSYWRSIINS